MQSTRPAPLRSVADTPEQLTFLGSLAPTDVPLQFRLDERTRRRGLAHIARIREQLDAIADRSRR